MIHKHHHHPSSIKSTQCENVSATTGLDPGQLTVMFLITLIASFCVRRARAGLCTLKVIQRARHHLIRSVSHRKAADSFFKVFQAKVWDSSMKRGSQIHAAWKKKEACECTCMCLFLFLVNALL